jgi:hypothetical protein
MRVVTFVFIVCLAAAPAVRAETFEVPGVGNITMFVVGDWHIAAEDMGDRFEIVIVPRNFKTGPNAACRISIMPDAPAAYDHPKKLRDRVIEATEKHLLDSREFFARTEAFYCRQSTAFGFYRNFTSAERYRKPVERGVFKVQTLGLLWLAPRVVASVVIRADDFYADEYQQLLGAVEGMEIRAPRVQVAAR